MLLHENKISRIQRVKLGSRSLSPAPKLLADAASFEPVQLVQKVVALSLERVDGLDEKPTLCVRLLELAAKVSDAQSHRGRWGRFRDPEGGGESLAGSLEFLTRERAVATQASMKRRHSYRNRQSYVRNLPGLRIEFAHSL
jgi:hypothetical protein